MGWAEGWPFLSQRPPPAKEENTHTRRRRGEGGGLEGGRRAGVVGARGEGRSAGKWGSGAVRLSRFQSIVLDLCADGERQAPLVGLRLLLSFSLPQPCTYIARPPHAPPYTLQIPPTHPYPLYTHLHMYRMPYPHHHPPTILPTSTPNKDPTRSLLKKSLSTPFLPITPRFRLPSHSFLLAPPLSPRPSHTIFHPTLWLLFELGIEMQDVNLFHI